MNNELGSQADASRRIQTGELLALQDRFHSDITGNSLAQAAGFQSELLFAALLFFSGNVLALFSL